MVLESDAYDIYACVCVCVCTPRRVSWSTVHTRPGSGSQGHYRLADGVLQGFYSGVTVVLH
jgi:hypothetical protein